MEMVIALEILSSFGPSVSEDQFHEELNIKLHEDGAFMDADIDYDECWVAYVELAHGD